MFRLLCAVAAICLAGAEAAASPAAQIQPVAGLTAFSLQNAIAADGAILTLVPVAGGLLRTVSAGGTDEKILFRLLRGKLGTVSETGGSQHVLGLFVLGERSIATEYDDGRSEILALDGEGGASLMLKPPAGGAVCTSWYPAGHRFSTAERKAELAAYALRLGIKGSSYAAAARTGNNSCRSLLEKNEQMRATVSRPVAEGGTGKLSAITAQLLTLYARKQPASLSYPEDTGRDGFENFYVNFLAAHEGGWTADDGNGSPANFGVNQGANPDLDVLNLTQTDAKQILHDRYWVASGADRLPAPLAAIHGDTAINLGVRTANEFLALSGGDPEAYLELRDQKYQAIAEADPEKAKYLPIWLSRNDDLRNFGQPGPPSYGDLPDL